MWHYSVVCRSQLIKTHWFRRAVGSHGHANTPTEVEQVIQTAAHGWREGSWHCSWRCTKTSTHLWVRKQQVTSKHSMSHFTEQSKRNKLRWNYLQQDFLQGRRQAEWDRNRNLRCNLKLHDGGFEEGGWSAGGSKKCLSHVSMTAMGVYTSNKQNNKEICTYIREFLLLCNWPFIVHTNSTN